MTEDYDVEVEWLDGERRTYRVGSRQDWLGKPPIYETAGLVVLYWGEEHVATIPVANIRAYKAVRVSG